MPGSPGDGLARADQAGGPPGDGPLARVGHRALVEVDVPGQVEGRLDRRRDEGLEMDVDHSAAPRRARVEVHSRRGPNGFVVGPGDVAAVGQREECLSPRHQLLGLPVAMSIRRMPAGRLRPR